MKSIKKGIEEYIQLKRAYGLRFHAGASTLTNFAKFCTINKYKKVTVAIMFEWIQTYPNASRENIARKLMTLRGFAAYWTAFDSTTELPPKRDDSFPIEPRKSSYLHAQRNNKYIESL
tara:strand:- start:8521 stop:8874 length:354 start_codon:yes stop_codon:yes gene_type:complete